MDLENAVFVVYSRDAIIMALLQVAMLVSVFLCGFYFGSQLKVDYGECVEDEDAEDRKVDDGSTFGPSLVD